MSPEQTSGEEGLASLWRIIHSVLEKARHRIYEEIKHYPRPIPACDAEFNHLLHERANIVQELQRMRECRSERVGTNDPLYLVTNFVRTSRYLNETEKEEILSSIPGQRN